MLPDINNSQLKRIQPSLFGVYPTLPEGELVQVWANDWLNCRACSLPSDNVPLTLEIDTAPGFAQKISVVVAEDSEKYRDALLSRWMQAGAPSVPLASPEAVLALIVSQFPGTPMPVWDNASIHPTHWQHTVAKAGMSGTEKAAHIIVEALVQETPLLSMLAHAHCPESVMRGLKRALPDNRAALLPHISSMIHSLHKKPGRLFLADMTRAQKEFSKLPQLVQEAGFIVLCGDRPAELLIQQLAQMHQVPVFQLDAQKLKRAEWLRFIEGAEIVGKEANLGVLRQRVLEQHVRAILSEGEAHVEPV